MASIPYKIVERTVNVKGELKKIYTPTLSSTGIVSSKSLANQIAVESTISDNEANRFIAGFAMIVNQALASGFLVKLDKLSTITPKMTAKAVDNPDEVTANTITNKSIDFRQSVEANTQLETASFRKINLNLKHV